MFNHITSLFTDETKLLPKLQHFYTTMPMFNVTTQKWTYDSAAEAELNKDWTYDPPTPAASSLDMVEHASSYISIIHNESCRGSQIFCMCRVGGSSTTADIGEPSAAATASLTIGDEEAQEYADFVTAYHANSNLKFTPVWWCPQGC
jgi:hypothetical protein